MCIKKELECEKGDIAKETLRYDIVVKQSSTLVEKSSTKGSVTISLWKNHDGSFEIASYDGVKWKTLRPFKIRDKDKAWEEYGKRCDDYECSAYPEAKEYYRRIYRSKGIKGIIESLGLEEHAD